MPFRASVESSITPPNRVDLQLVNGTQNQLEGSVLSSLVRSCGLDKAAAAGDHDHAHYLTIPLPDTLPVTFGLCGGSPLAAPPGGGGVAS